MPPDDPIRAPWYLTGPALMVSGIWLFCLLVAVLGGEFLAFERETSFGIGQFVFWSGTLTALFVVGAVLRDVATSRKPRK